MINYELRGKQGELLDLMLSDRNGCFVVSIRSGKTLLAWLSALVVAQAKPNQTILIACPTYPMIADIYFKAFVPMLDQFRGNQVSNINESDKSISFANGSQIIMRSTDRPERLRGLTVDLAILDEAAIMKADTVYEILNRLAATPGRSRGRVIMISSPAGRNHFHDFIFGTKNEPGIISSPHWHYRRYTAYDMGVMAAEEIAMLKATKSASTFAQDVMVEFSTLEGRVFSKFDENKHIAPYKPDYFKPIYIGVDFNVGRMSAVMAQQSDNRLHFFDEIVLSNSNTKEMSEAIRTRYGHSRLVVCPDATGAFRKSSADYGVTDILILKQHLGPKTEFRFGSHNPSVRDTINSTNELVDHNRLLVDPGCRETLKAMINMVYKEDGTPFKDNIHDHLFDCVRYVVAQTYAIKKSQDEDARSPARRGSGRLVSA